MIIAGTITAFQRLAANLKDRGAIPIRNNTTFLHRNHLMWMCAFAEEMLQTEDTTFPIDKASRWLGYVQGIMAHTGDINVMEERDSTRLLFT